MYVLRGARDVAGDYEGRPRGSRQFLKGLQSSAPDIWYHIYYDHMYVCTICMYVLQSYEEHETLRGTMENCRAAGAKLLEGFKVVRARHLVSHLL